MYPAGQDVSHLLDRAIVFTGALPMATVPKLRETGDTAMVGGRDRRAIIVLGISAVMVQVFPDTEAHPSHPLSFDAALGLAVKTTSDPTS